MNKAENPEYYAKIVDGEVKYVKKHKKTAFDVVLYIFFGLFGLLCIFPVVYLLLLSFASKADYLQAGTSTVILRLIRRKSLAPSTISVSESLLMI